VLDNSLANGRYRLDIIAGQVSGVIDPLAMAADVDFGADAADQFFRKFGDTNGDAVNNLLDFAAFRQTYGRSGGENGFNPVLDHDGNGLINLIDFAAFRQNYG
jgi:hypothetical protein